MNAHTMTRAEFDKLSVKAKADFCYQGGKITDTPSKATTTAAEFEKANIKTRAEFTTLAPKAQLEFVRGGGKITN